MTITLHGWGAMFDLPSPSPFVLKADIHMQLLGVQFERALADLDAVNKHKAPYVYDDGVLVQDSAFIRWHFETKLGKDLESGLSPQQRGAAWVLGTMLEQRLVPILVNERWMNDKNFDAGPRQFFAGVPEAMREMVVAGARGEVAATMQGNGIARYSHSELMQLAAADLAAVAQVLGDQPYLCGNQPSAVDGAGYGVLASAATRFFDSELPSLVEAHPNLADYIARMRQRFFPSDRWPMMG